MKGSIPDEVKEIVQQWLDATDQHPASHGGADYCYLNDNSMDYSQVSSAPVQLQTAWEDDTISVLPDGRIQVTRYVLPAVWDCVRIRRRCEDAMRKSNDLHKLLQVAAILSVKLD